MGRDDLDDRLHELRRGGGGPIDAIKLIQRAKGISLSDAKDHIAQHPAWADVHEAAEPFRDGLEQASRSLMRESDGVVILPQEQRRTPRRWLRGMWRSRRTG